MPEEKTFYLTLEGLEKLKKEYSDLKNLKLSKTKGEVPSIWESEDLNPEYLSFQEDLSFLESRISELEYILKNAKVIKNPPKEKQSVISLGAKVTLEDSEGRINEYMVVGTLEANPNEGKISSESPIGKILLGHKTRDQIFVTSPIKVAYRIKKIKYQSC